jgi:hypothetical protein
MPAATASMTPVEIQPMTHCGFGNLSPPVMVLFVVISMTRIMIRPAHRPLITALPKKRLDGTDAGQIQRQSEKRYRSDRSKEGAGAFQLLREAARPAGDFRQRIAHVLDGCPRSKANEATALLRTRRVSSCELIERRGHPKLVSVV